MIDFQSHLIFPVHAVPAAGPFPRGAERLALTSGQGDILQGIHIAPEVPDVSRTLLLGFGGNAWNGQDVAEYLHDLFPNHDVIVFHYRGYAPSAGSPSGEALTADAPLVYDCAVNLLRPERVIAVGFSIGTAVAAQLSSKRKLDGLILVTPFDSLKALAQAMFAWLPIGLIFAHEIDAAAALKDNQVPVALIAAERDDIVPMERTKALRNVVAHLAYERTIAGADHNDIYVRSDFHQAMHEALGRLKP